MVMVVENSASEIANFIKESAPESKETPKEEAKPEKAEAKPEPKKDDEDETPEFVKRLGLTPEQHKGITEVIRKSIDKKHRQAREAEEFAEAKFKDAELFRQRAEQAERERDELKKATQPAKEEVKRPDRTKFTDPNEYEEALLAWNRAEAVREFKEEQANEREEARKADILAAASARIAKAIELVPDYAEVTGAADDIIPNHIAAYMQESELFAELGYHFAKHPEDLHRIAAMPARTYSDLQRVGVALGKIESNIEPFADKAKANGSAPKSTNGTAEHETGQVPSQPRVAAPVIQPLSVGSASQVEKPAARRTYAEERAHFEKANGRDLSRRSRH